GPRIGLRHARKHLGWALDVAADSSGAPIDNLKRWRRAILTTESAAHVRRDLKQAFDDFASIAAAGKVAA
ncbi:MAG: tRNA dihydrouridine synthase DusB, partial [Tardiphaga sp.]|nr:tRNA dihydrouridine synthase DusB [Tardiphaga sp.]